MNRFLLILPPIALMSGWVVAAEPDAARNAATIYVTRCAACHGTRLQGSQGPSLVASKYLHGSDDETVARGIRVGYLDKGMPGWGSLITEPEIQGLVAFIKEQRSLNAPEYLATLDSNQKQSIATAVYKSELHHFHLQVVAEPGKPWGLAFLPDGRLLVAEEAGDLRVIAGSRLLPEPVKNTPRGRTPEDVFKRVLMDVAIHPDYQHNGWIYLSCGNGIHDADGKAITEVTLVRGRLKGNEWVDSQTLVRLPLNTDTGRITFDDKGFVYLATSGEAGLNGAGGAEPYSQEALSMMAAQDLNNLLGKILRFRDDGTVPADNPFIHSPSAQPAIWSVGHRNPQGLTFDPVTKQLWSTEHGPRGGDELNLIRAGHNYGWPVISYGTRYDGLALTTEIAKAGMDQPAINWTPSIGVSSVNYYDGTAFPKWRHNLIIGSLIQEELFRVVTDGARVALRESLLRGAGKIRSVATGPDGSIYLATALRQQGLILRLVPDKK
jgi:glucose/arabinose dehydrogenase